MLFSEIYYGWMTCEFDDMELADGTTMSKCAKIVELVQLIQLAYCLPVSVQQHYIYSVHVY